MGDLQNYTLDSNSFHSEKGFSLALNKDSKNKDKEMLTFILVSAMQIAFLSNNVSKELLGYDLSKPLERSKFITNLVSTIYMGYEKTESVEV